MRFGWLPAVEGIGIGLLILLLILVYLAIRRRWIARNGGTFECSMRRHTPSDYDQTARTGPERRQEQSSHARWVLGVARYNGEELQWFRFFSLSWRPKITYRRVDITVVGNRAPVPAEAVALYADQQIVSVVVESRGSSRRRDLAMTPDSVTGMLSWLEAAPPGVGGY